MMLSCQVIFDGEEAVDAGGVTKEFFLLLLKELMDPVYGMFTHYKESNLLWFSDKVRLQPPSRSEMNLKKSSAVKTSEAEMMIFFLSSSRSVFFILEAVTKNF